MLLTVLHPVHPPAWGVNDCDGLPMKSQMQPLVQSRQVDSDYRFDE